MNKRVDISYRTVVFITIFFLLLWILFLIRDIILLLFVAFIFMSAISPLVERLVKIRIPRPLAILICFIFIVGAFILMVTFGFTPLINQIAGLSEKLADIIGTLVNSKFVDQSIINQELSSLSHQVINFTVGLFENLIGFVSVVVMTFYLLLDREKIEGKTIGLFTGNQEKVQRLIRKIEYKLGAWLRGQLILSALIGILSYTGLRILGIENALPLAILAGFLEVVPVIGPIISAIPAILLALTISPFTAALVALLYLAIQQLEGHIVVPQVMKRAVGLNPLLVILAISVGGRLLGIAGALLAVPIAVVIQVIIEEVLTPSHLHEI
ncbi:AI-2E family transporter [Patescibacteria group bacterium]|nr:AI-2E family transporter [Patescibacteria group bacterium]MCL5409742.1 AI-2E family transporter [Patescibacteria group bacterium]